MSKKIVAYSATNKMDISDFVEIISLDKSVNLEKGLLKFHYGEIIDKPVSFFEKFKKREVDFRGYWINRGFGPGYLEEMFPSSSKYIDSPFWFVLGRGNDIGAALSFEARPESLLVNQIQGFRDEENVWGPLRYPDLLLDVCWDFIKECDIPELMVLPFSRNKWEDVRKNFQNTKKRQYDQPAKRNGFVYDNEREVYVRKNSL